MQENIRGIVRRFIVEQIASDEADDLADDANLKESGVLDSLSTLKLVSFLEETFHVAIQPDDLDAGHLASMASIERFIRDRRRVTEA